MGIYARSLLTLALMVSGAAWAGGAVEPATSSATPVIATSSTLHRLQDLIGSDALRELRTNYNGEYGASLLFHAETLTYYAALFQDKTFWRAISTTSETEAEEAYRAFAKQTEALADVDIRGIVLNAQKLHGERLLATDSERLEALQRDLAVQRQQAQQVATRQEQARQQTATLTSEQREVQARLTSLQSRIKALETQQADLTVSLPKPAAPVVETTPVITTPATHNPATTPTTTPAPKPANKN